MTRSVALSAVALAFSLAASVAAAEPVRCPTWACARNGTSPNGTSAQGLWENGVSWQGVWANGIRMQGVLDNGLRAGDLAAAHAAQPAVRAVVLPTGEIFTLR